MSLVHVPKHDTTPTSTPIPIHCSGQALGTFPAAEADEKCARAKALTRAWRSTMRPKPSREWVMLELERLQVRVVSGRLGRKGGADDDDDDGNKIGEQKKPNTAPSAASMMSQVTDPALLRRDSLLSGRQDSLLGTRRDSITGLLSAADMTSGTGRNNSLGWARDSGLDSLMQRRSSSLGLSVLPDDIKRRNSSLNLSSALDPTGGDPTIPPHRPLIGGGAAAAFEAARADHYNNMAEKARSEQQQQQRRASGLSIGGMSGGNMGSQMGLSVNPNQHYEMLKLHHMNLLNEIQETTLMMNLYQQQQLQQQQQQLQQQDNSVGGGGSGGPGNGGADAQMAMLLQHQQNQQQNGLSGQGIGGNIGGGQRMDSLGLGGPGGGSNDMQALLNQQRLMNNGGGNRGNNGGNPGSGNNGGGGGDPNNNNNNNNDGDNGGVTDEEKTLKDRLQALKADIARRQKEAEELEAATNGRNNSDKRKSDEGDGKMQKRIKTDNN